MASSPNPALITNDERKTKSNQPQDVQDDVQSSVNGSQFQPDQDQNGTEPSKGKTSLISIIFLISKGVALLFVLVFFSLLVGAIATSQDICSFDDGRPEKMSTKELECGGPNPYKLLHIADLILGILSLILGGMSLVSEAIKVFSKKTMLPSVSDGVFGCLVGCFSFICCAQMLAVGIQWDSKLRTASGVFALFAAFIWLGIGYSACWFGKLKGDKKAKGGVPEFLQKGPSQSRWIGRSQSQMHPQGPTPPPYRAQPPPKESPSPITV